MIKFKSIDKVNWIEKLFKKYKAKTPKDLWS